MNKLIALGSAFALVFVIKTEAQVDSTKVYIAYERLKEAKVDNKLIYKRGQAIMALVDETDGSEMPIGLKGARRLLFGQATHESVGLVTDTLNGCYGAWHVRKSGAYADYFETNPNAKWFPIEDLAKPENAGLSLDIMSSYIKRYHLRTIQEFVRVWNGGPDGATPTAEISKLVAPEDKAEHESELQTTLDYANTVLRYRDFVRDLIERRGLHTVL